MTDDDEVLTLDLSDMICFNCRWWRLARDSYEGPQCHYYPPKIPQERYSTWQSWPEASAEDFCSKWSTWTSKQRDERLSGLGNDGTVRILNADKGKGVGT